MVRLGDVLSLVAVVFLIHTPSWAGVKNIGVASDLSDKSPKEKTELLKTEKGLLRWLENSFIGKDEISARSVEIDPRKLKIMLGEEISDEESKSGYEDLFRGMGISSLLILLKDENSRFIKFIAPNGDMTRLRNQEWDEILEIGNGEDTEFHIYPDEGQLMQLLSVESLKMDGDGYYQGGPAWAQPNGNSTLATAEKKQWYNNWVLWAAVGSVVGGVVFALTRNNDPKPETPSPTPQISISIQ